ncbi:MAG: hypothetical protein GEU75_15070 [Dehalococcoidia bacterium]|nr:hypothetical protein [Dehalococcoidia bacterium]
MEAYVAVISHHGSPEEVKLFTTEDAARGFALDLAKTEEWEDKKEHGHDGHDHDDADHTHEHEDWLEEWGDEDGCGVVVGKAST